MYFLRRSVFFYARFHFNDEIHHNERVNARFHFNDEFITEEIFFK